MAVSVVSTVFAAPAEQVWARIGDFAGWHKWIERLLDTHMDPGQENAPVGSVRNIHTADGRIVRERLVAFDQLRRTLSYDFPDGSIFPVRRYLATVRVEPITVTEGTYVNWAGDFDSDADQHEPMMRRFASIYEGFLSDLATHLEA